MLYKINDVLIICKGDCMHDLGVLYGSIVFKRILKYQQSLNQGR